MMRLIKSETVKQPNGYMVSPTNKKQWIVDGEAAVVVKRIFDLCIGGKGPMQIAKILKENNVLTVKAYYAKKKGNPFSDNPYNWEGSTQVCGDRGTCPRNCQ